VIDKDAQDFVQREGSLITHADAQTQILMTRETASFEDYRDYKDAGFGLSGSSQPNPEDFVTLKEKVGQSVIFDLDLREEPHFYLDNKSVCFLVYPPEAADYYHKPNYEVVAYETSLFDKMISPVDLYEHIPGAIDTSDVHDTHAVPFSSKTWEADACKEAGVEYRRVSITDGQRPQDGDVDQLIRIFRQVEENSAWLHVHCRDGHGRTTTVMVMYDIFCNARKMSCEDIVARHKVVNLFSISDGKPVKVDFMDHVRFCWKVDRADFIAKFYRFCFTYMDELHAEMNFSWSKYIKQYLREWR